ncbi:MAG: hypothetical protein OCC49_18960 [Fibrobacterales bacterium]
MSILKCFFLVLTSVLLISCSKGFVNSNRATDSSPKPYLKEAYILYHMGVQNIGDASRRDSDYLKLISESFGISKELAILYLKKVEISTPKQRTKKCLYYLQESLKELSVIKKQNRQKFFVINVLNPYFSLLINNVAIPNAFHKNIAHLIPQYLSGKNAKNEFKKLVRMTIAFDSFKEVDVSIVDNFNVSLHEIGYHMFYNLDNPLAHVFEINSTLLDKQKWSNKSETITIYMLKRIAPNLLPDLQGFSLLGTKEVFVISDFFPLLAEAYLQERTNKLTPGDAFVDKKNEEVWKELSIDLTIENANSILERLTKKDFSKTPKDSIVLRLAYAVAIHEAKHKADEYETDKILYSVDFELSAYLAQILYSDTPFHSLRMALSYFENMYEASEVEIYLPIMKKLWNVAIKTAEPDVTTDIIKKEVLKIYEAHRIYSGGYRFPKLNSFKKKVVPFIKKDFM